MAAKKPMLLKTDLHIHTFYSGDSNIKPEEIIEQAKLKNLDVVGITDHNTTRGALETRKLAAKKAKNLIVLIGQEVRTNHGEIIVFGPTQNIKKRLSPLKTCRIAKRLGGFIVIPHPFDIFREGIGKKINDILPYMDAIEVFNSKTFFDKFNKTAMRFAETHKIPKIACSDAHRKEDIGNSQTLIYSRPDERAVFNSIKSGRTEMITNKTGFKNRFFSLIRCGLNKTIKP